MNTYIQDKLGAFDEKVNNTYEFFNATDGGGELQFTINEIDVDGVRNFIEQSLTDYHNHIVEKIESEFDENTWTEQDGIRYDTMLANRKLQKILSLLQDTNPKE